MADVYVSVGSTGRDYADIPALFAGIPNGSADHYIAELYNDSEFVISATTNYSKTTRLTMRPAAGHGFADHVDHLTNPLKYDQSKGVGIRMTMDFQHGLQFSSEQSTITGMQVRVTA